MRGEVLGDCWCVGLWWCIVVFEKCFCFWFFLFNGVIFKFFFNFVFENFISLFVSWLSVCIIGIFVFLVFLSVFDMFFSEWVCFLGECFLLFLLISFELDFELRCIRLVLCVLVFVVDVIVFRVLIIGIFVVFVLLMVCEILFKEYVWCLVWLLLG